MNDDMPREEHPLNALTEQASSEEKKKAAAAHANGQRAVRTLEGDIAEAVAERNASMASMVIAEQEKPAEPARQPEAARSRSNAGKKILIGLASLVLVALGIGTAYYLYTESPLAPQPPAVQKPAPVPSIVKADSQKALDIGGLGQKSLRQAVLTAVADAGQGGTIEQIIPEEKTSSGAAAVDAADFLTALGIVPPDVLERSLGASWMLGAYDDAGTEAPFIILTNDFFQNAYAGMISWEKTMPDDLAGFFVNAGEADASGNGAATSSIASYFSIPGAWQDGVIENKDVRIFVAPDGTVLLLYSFVDNGTLVITTDENALAEIITRLENQTYAR